VVSKEQGPEISAIIQSLLPVVDAAVADGRSNGGAAGDLARDVSSSVRRMARKRSNVDDSELVGESHGEHASGGSGGGDSDGGVSSGPAAASSASSGASGNGVIVLAAVRARHLGTVPVSVGASTVANAAVVAKSIVTLTQKGIRTSSAAMIVSDEGLRVIDETSQETLVATTFEQIVYVECIDDADKLAQVSLLDSESTHAGSDSCINRHMHVPHYSFCEQRPHCWTVTSQLDCIWEVTLRLHLQSGKSWTGSLGLLAHLIACYIAWSKGFTVAVPQRAQVVANSCGKCSVLPCVRAIVAVRTANACKA
jgi:hypothetical protein